MSYDDILNFIKDEQAAVNHMREATESENDYEYYTGQSDALFTVRKEIESSLGYTTR